MSEDKDKKKPSDALAFMRTMMIFTALFMGGYMFFWAPYAKRTNAYNLVGRVAGVVRGPVGIEALGEVAADQQRRPRGRRGGDTGTADPGDDVTLDCAPLVVVVRATGPSRVECTRPSHR